ncbi:hypothetical protein Goshw_013253 [Gossypium schwendimanii]|uniref:Uncharacterized protein n=1 Tax=Gossypium schwendimanii TaxID=34291 RepID=A0A7J9MSS4_GOSSC|nr:hypothetical protein [Gossypium schwendimanii]
MKTRDTHIASSTRRLSHHFGRRVVIISVTSEWVRTHRVRSIC